MTIGRELIPEQVWDGPDIPHRELFNGQPAGSAMPLAWAHAEFVKLARSLRDGRVFDTPPQPVQRYVRDQRRSEVAVWCVSNKLRSMDLGKALRVSTRAPALVHWSVDDWRSACDTQSTETGLGVWYADLPTRELTARSVVRFTLFWADTERWEGTNFEVRVA